ncbi:hypothetical protein [Streptomyces sp. NBC_00162]|uniref:hypothetical protein n=1 Tax=Streptomyces sp. NBC_00162 TaxID=2903629 RepID=UPI00214B74F2|nr:hypothetical protein [Streptomyces sp. NBC_00162]UUU37740.1 hypothetical protein JIW86_01760 [Streptomyces sp. NBC_00162]
MNLHINGENALVVALSCVVAYVVYRRTQSHQQSALTGRPGRGGLVAALTAGAATLLLLAFLFGLGDGSAKDERPSSQPPASGEVSPGS